MIKVADNVILIPITLNDVSDIFNTIDTERNYLREWLPFVDSTKHESDTLAFVESVIGSGLPPFKLVVDGVFSGLVGIVNYDKLNRKLEIGYWMSEKIQGQGIMTKSVYAMLKYVFVELNVNRVQIKVAVDNIRSRKIPQRLNFEFEGVERDGELLVDNKFADIAVYSILKKEFLL